MIYMGESYLSHRIVIDQDKIVGQQVIVAGSIFRFGDIDDARQLDEPFDGAGNIEFLDILH